MIIIITAFKNNAIAGTSLVVGHLAMTCDAEKRNMATEGFLESVTCYQKTKIVEIMAERGCLPSKSSVFFTGGGFTRQQLG